jgi:type VI secretion system protein VasG
MAEINRISLFGKLNSVGFKSLESSTVFCKLRGNPYVELAHWLYQILQLNDSDIHRIIRYSGIDSAKLAKHFIEHLDTLPRGSTSISDFSPHLEEAVERAWVYGSLLFKESQIRTGHVVVGILKTSGLKHVLLGISSEFAKIKLEQLTDEFSGICDGSPEASLGATDGTNLQGQGSQTGGADASSSAAMGKQEALAKYSVDLTSKAKNGEMDPIVGRDEEIRQLIDVLMRRRQNNPILTGEAGVGKTAVVEGFAQRIVSGDVPPALRDVSLRVLDVGLLQAGASVKGEFENRLRQVIEEVQRSPKPIILFIDEAHTLIGAGGAAGTGDAANLLKPALARGTLRTIAATTWGEYKKYIEKDPALTRRFQVIKVEEPGEDKAVNMMRALAFCLEKHHRVQILDEALQAAVRLSKRYIPARQLPDKAVSLLDTACARVAISQHACPPQVDDSRRRIEAFKTELGIIDREIATGLDRHKKREETVELLHREEERCRQTEKEWGEEKKRVDQILELRARLQTAVEKNADAKTVRPSGTGETVKVPGGPTPDGSDSARAAESATQPERDAMLVQLRDLLKQLEEIQGERPLVLPCVDTKAVSSVVADWTGIPVGGMMKNEIEAVLRLADTLKKRVIGQDHALEAIAKRIRTSRAGIENPNKPIGVMLLVGPSGVGKTESAIALAEALYGGEENLITINMSEFQEAHTVSTLKGSPPGYVGYGEGGVLTEAVRRRPYSIVLLDEVEKAHADVHEIFFQVFDKGHMEDAEGRDIDFTNTIILLTSNVGTDLVMNMCKDPGLMPDPEGIAKALRGPLLKVFPPALLGRLVVVPYYPITDENLQKIIRLQLDRIGRRVKSNHGIPFTYTDDVVRLVASRCTEVESGARMVDAILTHVVLPDISRELLNRLIEGKAAKCVSIGTMKSEFTYSFE